MVPLAALLALGAAAALPAASAAWLAARPARLLAAAGPPDSGAAPADPGELEPVQEPVEEVPNGTDPTQRRGPDPDFEPLPGETSIAFGPVRPTRLQLSAEGGWLRSGAGFQAGMGSGVDVVFRFDTFYPAVTTGGQSAFYAGLRWSSQELVGLRVAAALEAGAIFPHGRGGSSALLVVRPELTVGTELAGWRPVARAAFSLLADAVDAGDRWGQSGEVGLGLERTFGRSVVAAEAISFLQPGVSAIGMWRLRVGHAF